MFLVTESARRLVVAASLTEAEALSLYTKLRSSNLFTPALASLTPPSLTFTIDCRPDEAKPMTTVRVADLLELVKTAKPEDVVQFMLEDGGLRYRLAGWQQVG